MVQKMLESSTTRPSLLTVWLKHVDDSERASHRVLRRHSFLVTAATNKRMVASCPVEISCQIFGIPCLARRTAELV